MTLNEKKVLITGATGFLGQELCQELHQNGIPFDIIIRKTRKNLPLGAQKVHIVSNLLEAKNWEELLSGVESIIHLIGLAHSKENPSKKSEYYKKINRDISICLMKAAIKARVKKFIYISSLKVNGESSKEAFKESDPPRPEDNYGLSKSQAEHELLRLASSEGAPGLIILRPPLIYGPGVKANFKSLLKLTKRRVPLPLKNISNKRSLIYSKNLTHLIRIIIKKELDPNFGPEIYLVSDDHDLSTPQMIDKMAIFLQKKAATFSFPQVLLKTFLKGIKKESIYVKIAGDLYADISKIKKDFNWTPPHNIDQAFKQTVEAFLKEDPRS